MSSIIFYLDTCDTCKRILKEIEPTDKTVLQNIKKEPIRPEQLDALAAKVGSYEALFSRIAKKYKEMGLKDKNLTEDDYRTYILSEYTFLKRPVMCVHEQIFIGNAPNVVAQAKEAFRTI